MFYEVPSAMVSKHHEMMFNLGYPQLDVVEHKDGSWSIIEYLNAPTVPSLTRWHHVLSDIRHQEINESFCKRMIERMDLTKPQTWETMRKEEEAKLAQAEWIEEQRADNMLRGAKELAKNDVFMDIVDRMGPEAFNLESLARTLSSGGQSRALGTVRRTFGT
jgi:hypothetical protein